MPIVETKNTGNKAQKISKADQSDKSNRELPKQQEQLGKDAGADASVVLKRNENARCIEETWLFLNKLNQVNIVKS